MRRTKIICTLGPASSSSKTIKKMALAGMDIARLNFSHGTQEEHQKVVNVIRAVNKQLRKSIRILQDLEGYRIRVGFLKRPMELKQGQIYWLSFSSAEGKASNFIPIDSEVDMKSLSPGMHVYLCDGYIDLEIEKCLQGKIQLRVLQGGVITSKKGINIPGLELQSNILTPKDRSDIEFGIHNRVDYIAQSFVRNKDDIQRVVDLVRPRLANCKIIAKIESKEGLNNIEKIIDACDGIMVARGDLGVSLPIWQVPIFQKRIIFQANKKKKMDITATQMLESMTDHKRPTRAEVSDVANAILDGSDCVMLSGETAVGRYPVETIEMMRRIIEFTEKNA